MWVHLPGVLKSTRLWGFMLMFCLSCCCFFHLFRINKYPPILNSRKIIQFCGVVGQNSWQDRILWEGNCNIVIEISISQYYYCSHLLGNYVWPFGVWWWLLRSLRTNYPSWKFASELHDVFGWPNLVGENCYFQGMYQNLHDIILYILRDSKSTR